MTQSTPPAAVLTAALLAFFAFSANASSTNPSAPNPSAPPDASAPDAPRAATVAAPQPAPSPATAAGPGSGSERTDESPARALSDPSPGEESPDERHSGGTEAADGGADDREGGDEPGAADRDPSLADTPSARAPASTVRDEIVVSAHRLPVPAGEVGSTVTVIDREEIELRHEPSVLELLRTVPGLAVAQGGGAGRVASVFLRGADSEHTLVLVDGVRVNSLNGGSFDFSALSGDNLERVEVLRGPQSTLYGSEAMGGVISITTRRGRGAPSWSVDARVGELGTRRLAAAARGARGAFDYSLSAAGLETDGVSSAAESRGNRERDPYENATLSGRLGWDYGDGRADLAVRWTDTESALDGFAFGVGPVDDPDYVQSRTLAHAALSVDHALAPGWAVRLSAGTARDESEGEDPTTPAHPFLFESRLDRVGVQTEVDLSAAGELTAGYELERRSAENRGAFDDSEDLASVYLDHRWSWRDRLHLTAGARHDDYARFGEETTWRLTGSFAVTDGTRLHGSWGTGFRVPTFTELFFPGAGNAALAPESNEGGDLGVEQRLAGGRVRLDVTLFRNRFDELIVFDFASLAFANVASAEAEGVEALVEVRPRRDLTLTATWTRTDSLDPATGRPLPRRPEDRGTLQLLYAPAGGWRLAADLVAVSDRVEFDGTPMDDYERLDLALEAPAWGPLRPYLRVDNLLDAGYQEVPGFTTPGRLAALGLRLEL